MSVHIEIESTVKSGFPVHVEAGFISYDDGLELDYLELYTPAGKKADWLSPTKADLERLERECREKLSAEAAAEAERIAELKYESKQFWSY